MMSKITIPPEALEAGREAFLECDVNPSYSFDDVLRAAFLAMLEAWPGTRIDDTYRWLSNAAIILPMEDKNAES